MAAPPTATFTIPPHLIPSKNTTIILVAAAAAAVPVAYVISVRRSCLKRARICPGKPSALPASMPDEVRDCPDDGSGDVVLSHERLVSTPVAVSSLRPDLQVEEEGLDVILTPYARATMASWLDTHGGKAVRKLLAGIGEGNEGKEDEDLVRSFSPEHIADVEFEEGDLVNGIYKVTHRGESADGGERVEFTITPPPVLLDMGKDLAINGIVVTGWEVVEPESAKDEEEGVNLVFVNETWMWRRKGEKKTLLEKPLGRWWHSGLVGWMIGKGIDAVTVPADGAKAGTQKEKKPVPAPAVVKVVPEKEPLKDGAETETETETSASEDEE